MFNLLKFVFSPHQWVELFTFYGGGKTGGDAPDFTALAAAAEKAAVLGKELGDAQLAENVRQYDNNMAVTTPVVNAQLGLMNMTKEQGDDYFNYMKQYARPVEQQLFYEAMGFTPEEVSQLNQARQVDTEKNKTTAQAKYQQDLEAWNQQFEQLKSTNTGSQASIKLIKPDGAILGSDIIAERKRLGLYNPDSFATNTTIFGTSDWNPIDPNAYYTVPYGHTSPHTTYEPVAVRYEMSGDTGNAKFDSEMKTLLAQRPKYQESSNIDYSESDKVASQFGMAAKERMDAQDKAGRDKILAKNNELAGRIGETDTQVYNRYANDIEAEAGQAVADSRAGFTNAINVAARQGLRYGFSPEKLAAAASGQSAQQAAAQASAANQTRKSATQTMYGRGVGQIGEELKGITADRNFKIQDSAIATAKKQDVAGLYRNLPAASQGSYSLATNAGNSAVNNQNQTSNQYMQGVNQGNALIMQGQQTAVQGLGSMVNAQTSYANSGSDSGIWGALGTVGGAALSKYSDKNMKKDIKPISDEKALEGIKKTGISKWKYDPKKVTDAEFKDIDNKEHVGAMAQDLRKNLGKQVSDGKMVDVISAIGVTMAATKALAKKVDKLAKDKNNGKNK